MERIGALIAVPTVPVILRPLRGAHELPIEEHPPIAALRAIRLPPSIEIHPRLIAAPLEARPAVRIGLAAPNHPTIFMMSIATTRPGCRLTTGCATTAARIHRHQAARAREVPPAEAIVEVILAATIPTAATLRRRVEADESSRVARSQVDHNLRTHQALMSSRSLQVY